MWWCQFISWSKFETHPSLSSLPVTCTQQVSFQRMAHNYTGGEFTETLNSSVKLDLMLQNVSQYSSAQIETDNNCSITFNCWHIEEISWGMIYPFNPNSDEHLLFPFMINKKRKIVDNGTLSRCESKFSDLTW